MESTLLHCTAPAACPIQVTWGCFPKDFWYDIPCAYSQIVLSLCTCCPLLDKKCMIMPCLVLSVCCRARPLPVLPLPDAAGDQPAFWEQTLELGTPPACSAHTLHLQSLPQVRPQPASSVLDSCSISWWRWEVPKCFRKGHVRAFMPSVLKVIPGHSTG